MTEKSIPSYCAAVTLTRRNGQELLILVYVDIDAKILRPEIRGIPFRVETLRAGLETLIEMR